MTKPIILVVSDEPLGMGSPQIMSFAVSVAEHANTKATIVCTKATDKLAVAVSHPSIEVIDSGITFQERRTFIAFVAKLLRSMKPDILVFFSNLALPALFDYHHRPRLTINYVLESYYLSDDLISSEGTLVRTLQDRIDLFILPEQNRAAQFVKLGKIDAPRLRVLYNCKRYDQAPARLPASERNGLLIHQGSIFADEEPWLYLYRGEREFAIDIYGIFRGRTWSPTFGDKFDLMCKSSSSTRYLGKVGDKELDDIRPKYSYLLAYWHPNNPAQLYACPNKFFEAVASGVPPLASPNPQMRELIERYDCGILLQDWTYEAFLDAYDYAMDIRGTERYESLVANCLSAYEAELNWERQFRKLVPVLDEALGKREKHFV